MTDYFAWSRDKIKEKDIKEGRKQKSPLSQLLRTRQSS
jgi:hypothetical protein